MKTTQRYEPHAETIHGKPSVVFRITESGGWVLHSDHLATVAGLEAELQRLNAPDPVSGKSPPCPVPGAPAGREGSPPPLHPCLAPIPHLLSWAESIICNAVPMSHWDAGEWHRAVKNWRDQVHGVKHVDVSPPPSPASEPVAASMDDDEKAAWLACFERDIRENLGAKDAGTRADDMLAERRKRFTRYVVGVDPCAGPDTHGEAIFEQLPNGTVKLVSMKVTPQPPAKWNPKIGDEVIQKKTHSVGVIREFTAHQPPRAVVEWRPDYFTAECLSDLIHKPTADSRPAEGARAPFTPGGLTPTGGG